MNYPDPFNPSAPRGSVSYTQTTPGFTMPMDEFEQPIEEDAQRTHAFGSITAITFTICFLLAVQCFRLQVVQGSENQAKAEGNSIRILTTTPDRGLIVDASGTILAQNAARASLVVHPRDLPHLKAERETIYTALQKEAGVDGETTTLIEKNRTSSGAPVAIQTNLDKDTALLYKERLDTLPGVEVQQTPIRSYANLASLGQILGYVGATTQKDVDAGATIDQRLGKSGLEATYNTILTGTIGHERVEVDAFGDTCTTCSTVIDNAKTGQTLKLSLDARVQQIVADALKNELGRREKRFGSLEKLGASAVVIDPSTGGIKAMVSLPDYASNTFAAGITQKDYQSLVGNPGNPLLNRAIQGQFQSGSVIKPLIAAAALEEGVITGTTQMDTPKAICVAQTCFPDWKLHTRTDTRTAIATSNNIFFYAIGGGWEERGFTGLGIERLNTYLRAFGLGSETGIDIPGEQAGLIPTPDWKKKLFEERWYIGDTYNTSIGQGYTLVTPLQMAVGTAAIANGGTVWKPSLAEATIDPETGKETPLPHSPLTERVASPENIQIVREGMRQTVVDGSSRPLGKLQVASAGKTGTAQFGNEGRTHAWYTGFAPYDNPKYAFAILIEGGGESYTSSVPTAEEILRGLFNEPLADGQKLFADPADLAAGYEFQGER